MWQYVVVTGSTWRLLPRKISPIYCHVSYVAVTRIPLLVLRNMWHYVIIRYSYGELPKFVLRCSYEVALRKGVTTALPMHCGWVYSVETSSLVLIPQPILHIAYISGDTSYRYQHSGYYCWHAHFRSNHIPRCAAYMQCNRFIYLAEDSKHSMNFWYCYTEGLFFFSSSSYMYFMI